MSTRIIVYFWIFVSVFIGYAQEGLQNISFQELQKHVDRKSPVIKQFEKEYDLEISASKIALQWSNPQFNLSQESVDDGNIDQNETMLFLSKDFQFPWIYLKHRQSWQNKIKAADYNRQEQTRRFYAEIKSGYIEIYLLQNSLDKLDKIKATTQELSRVAQNQSKEGALSDLNLQLINMTVLSLESEILQFTKNIEEKVAIWKTKIGVEENQKINLTSTIFFKPVPNAHLEQPEEIWNNYPGILSKQMEQRSIQNLVVMEKMRIVPNINIYGGYKKLNPDFNGYVMGVSFDLPIFNQNRANIGYLKNQQVLQKLAIDVYQQNLMRQFNSAKKLVFNYENTLQKLKINGDPLEILGQILTSYKEGWATFSETLNTIQILSSGIQSYNKLLTDYYQQVFKLEIMLDKPLVQFD